jgi:hypothetical protein
VEGRVRLNVRTGDFSRDLAPWMKSCLRAGGVPIFKTRFLGLEFEDSVLGVCYGGGSTVRSFLFTNVPPEDIAKMRSGSPDWPYLAEKYGDEELRNLVRQLRSVSV